MATVKTDNKHYAAIAEKIREKTGEAVTYKPDEMPSGVDAVFAAGQENGYKSGYDAGEAAGHASGYADGHNAGYAEGESAGYATGKTDGYAEGESTEYDRFWDAFQLDTVGAMYMFAGNGWNDETFKPKYNIPFNSGTCSYTFYNTHITDLEALLNRQNVTLDLSSSTRLDYAFCNSTWLTTLPEIVIGDKCTLITGMFGNAYKLTTIRKLTFPDKNFTVTNAFTDCNALENIEIGGTIACNGLDFHWSTNLSKASITSIINALSTTTGGFAITLSKAAVNAAFETSEGAADGSTSDEWLTLIATKSNWTISLV